MIIMSIIIDNHHDHHNHEALTHLLCAVVDVSVISLDPANCILATSTQLLTVMIVILIIMVIVIINIPIVITTTKIVTTIIIVIFIKVETIPDQIFISIVLQPK